MPWIVQALNPRHNRSHFSCGNEALDQYLRQQASQDIKRRFAKVFVACQPGSAEILGFYTLSAASFSKDFLPPESRKRSPYADVPAVLIGRLAVDQAWQGKRLGEFLLVDACRRVVDASQNTLAINAILVRAKDEKTKGFYMRYGFMPFMNEPLHLFIPTRTIEEAGE